MFSSEGDGFTQNENKWDLAVGAHQHLEIWFTQPGNYDLGLTWTGQYIGGGPAVDVVGSGTFGFQVVPEPGAVGMLASGLLGMMFLRRRVA